MHVRQGLLAVLLLGPGYGQQLARELERRTGTAVNAGQISSTLERLARDALVADAGVDAAGRRRVGVTPAGRDAVAAWAARGEDEDSGAVLALLASVDPELGAQYAETRLARLGSASTAAAADVTPDTGRPALLDALLSERRLAAASAEREWLQRWAERLRREPEAFELPLGAEPRRGRPQRRG